MPLLLYDLPNWLFGTLVCGGWIVIGLGGDLVFHRLCKARFEEGEKNLAIALLAVVATVNSLLLAFTAISVWESFGVAEKAVHDESITVSSLGRDLAVFNTPAADRAREQLKAYAKGVVEREWESMRSGRPDSSFSSKAMNDLFLAIGDIQPATPRELVLMPEIWARANELVKHRRERLYAGEAQVPGTLWTVVTIGTFLTILTTYVFPRTAFNLAAVAVLSGSLGLVFFFVAAMDRPFAGKESVGPAPIEAVIASMERWDRDVRKPQLDTLQGK
jgi:hypothetical protein